MRIEWLNKKNNDRLIVFFNGWGMDKGVVSHLSSNCDVIMFYDYRHLNTEIGKFLILYKEVYVVAWSMGIWAASYFFTTINFQPTRLIGFNGTEQPVNDRHGIPEKVYQITEKGMNEQGREKFLKRMVINDEEWAELEKRKSQRTMKEVREELIAIREQSQTKQGSLEWDKIYISEKDVIFPPKNQMKWWENRAKEIKKLSGGHYPLGDFITWEEIIF